MFVMYQSSGPIVGVGETVDACIEDAVGYMEGRVPLVNEMGQELDPDNDYLDYSRMDCQWREIAGELYVRRVTLALYERLRDDAHRESIPYTVGTDGVVRELSLEGTP